MTLAFMTLTEKILHSNTVPNKTYLSEFIQVWNIFDADRELHRHWLPSCAAKSEKNTQS
jgi:hypothetical protein